MISLDLLEPDSRALAEFERGLLQLAAAPLLPFADMVGERSRGRRDGARARALLAWPTAHLGSSHSLTVISVLTSAAGGSDGRDRSVGHLRPPLLAAEEDDRRVGRGATSRPARSLSCRRPSSAPRRRRSGSGARSRTSSPTGRRPRSRPPPRRPRRPRSPASRSRARPARAVSRAARRDDRDRRHGSRYAGPNWRARLASLRRPPAALPVRVGSGPRAAPGLAAPSQRGAPGSVAAWRPTSACARRATASTRARCGGGRRRRDAEVVPVLVVLGVGAARCSTISARGCWRRSRSPRSAARRTSS